MKKKFISCVKGKKDATTTTSCFFWHIVINCDSLAADWDMESAWTHAFYTLTSTYVRVRTYIRMLSESYRNFSFPTLCFSNCELKLLSTYILKIFSNNLFIPSIPKKGGSCSVDLCQSKKDTSVNSLPFLSLSIYRYYLQEAKEPSHQSCCWLLWHFSVILIFSDILIFEDW